MFTCHCTAAPVPFVPTTENVAVLPEQTLCDCGVTVRKTGVVEFVASYAPMSTLPPAIRGSPAKSRVEDTAGLVPALMAGEAVCKVKFVLPGLTNSGSKSRFLFPA